LFWEKGKKEKGKRIEMIKGREKGFVQVVRKKREKKKGKLGSWEVEVEVEVEGTNYGKYVMGNTQRKRQPLLMCLSHHHLTKLIQFNI